MTEERELAAPADAEPGPEEEAPDPGDGPALEGPDAEDLPEVRNDPVDTEA